MNAEFKIGDVVQINGGPMMTVDSGPMVSNASGEVRGSTCATSAVWCVWFDLQHRVQREIFLTSLLQRVDPDSSQLHVV